MRLSHLIDWGRLEQHFAPYYAEEGWPGVAIRLIVGLHLLKHVKALSDEMVCAEWEENAYMQYFCGEEYFQHRAPCERSGMTHFRGRVGGYFYAPVSIFLRTGAASSFPRLKSKMPMPSLF